VAHENVETLELGYRLLAARDFEGIAPLLDQDFELRPGLAGASEGAVYRGVDGLRRYVSDMAQTWERFQQVPERFIDSGDDVIALVQVEAKGRGSGIELSQQMAIHWTFRNGRVLRGVGYLDVAAALDAAGLRDTAVRHVREEAWGGAATGRCQSTGPSPS
jgi:ketosteroid isomerase-like protein